MNVPPKGYFITGTDTGVGKTVVTALLLRWMQEHHRAAGVMKPVETGVDPECHSAANSDALFLMEVSGLQDPPGDVSPYRFKAPASPYQSARLQGRQVSPSLLTAAFNRLAARHDLMLVEGIGGLLVPLTAEMTVAGLAREWDLPLILVTRYTLGTVNHTLLTLQAAREHGLPVTGLVFNQTAPGPLSAIERDQPRLLAELTGVRVLGEMPYFPKLEAAMFTRPFLETVFAGWDAPDLLAL
ncbi:MAG: dethiobiotin synthase [Nitrospinaceae bacterium]